MTVYAGLYGPVGYEYPSGQHAASVAYRVTTSEGADIVLYTSKSKSVTKPNPSVTDEFGNISFYANPGEYEISVNDGDPFTISVPLHPDEPIEGGGGVGGDADRILTTAVAGETLSGHRLVNPRPNGSIMYANPASLTYLHAPIWMTLGAIMLGEEADVLAYGPAEEDSWAWTPGPLFLGASGTIVSTPPAGAYMVQVGYATTAQSLVLDRSPSIVLSS